MPRTLDTERLHLRPPGRSDARAIFAYSSDRAVMRYMVWPTAVEFEDTCDFLDDVAAGWAEGDDFCYLVVQRASEQVCGAISCQFDQHGAELGYILASEYWGRGYATEAARAVIDSIWRIDGVYRIWATCDTCNLASIHVLEKLGMSCEGRLKRWAPCPNLYGDPAPRDVYCYSLSR